MRFLAASVWNTGYAVGSKWLMTAFTAPKLMLFLLFVVVALSVFERCAIAAEPIKPPPVPREFRAAWIATVANIDWPSRPGLPVDEMKAELAGLFDLCVELKLNAVVLQVRPACDALYASELEPWSEFLTGKQGQAPPDGFDPLHWACGEAHARGLELHAWFNPYRALHPSAKGPLAESHIAKRRPDLAPEYGKQRWLDPGAAEAVEHSMNVVLDVVRRYDVDAVHFDDYFYPYPATDALDGQPDTKVEVPFPDDISWHAYCDATPAVERLSRDDWRRDNVNRFVRNLGQAIHAAKPHVRFGISPFGIWRPGHPESIQGFDQYAKLYADARLWLREGWVDYFSPQLYWAIDKKAQSFTTLLAWWANEKPKACHLWPGLYTSRVGGEKPQYPPKEVVDQIVAAREQAGASGHIHFSIKALAKNWAGVADLTRASVYTEAAVPPACDWLAGDEPLPKPPRIGQVVGSDVYRLTAQDDLPTRWVVQKRCDGNWTTELLGSAEETIRVDERAVDAIAVSAVDRYGRVSEPTVVTIGAQAE